jgi:DNA-binding NarL/FixJ family response regulator
MNRIRILLADDHQMFVAGLRKLLEADFDVVGAVADGREMVRVAQAISPDVIVADISMPSLNGIDAAVQLRAAKCKSKLIFLTMQGDSMFLREAVRVGAAGFVLKRDAPDTLVFAIRQVARGKTYFSPDVLPDLQEQPLGELTGRQREVLQLVAEGRALKEIATALNISAKTAEFHKAQLMRRLGVRSGAELTAIAIRHGLVAL